MLRRSSVHEHVLTSSVRKNVIIRAEKCKLHPVPNRYKYFHRAMNKQLKCRVIIPSLCLFVLMTTILMRNWTLLSYQFKIYQVLDYPLHDFRPNMAQITNHCIVHPWHNKKKLTVYDCTDINSTLKSNNATPADKDKQLTIAIASFHHYPNKHELTRYEKLILTNHIGYSLKHKYIYFDANTLLFDTQTIQTYFDTHIPAANAMFKAQKPFIIHSILTDKLYGKRINYVMWIDFDAIFYNCSTSIESIIEYAQNLYDSKSLQYSSDSNAMDIIFSRDYFSISNSGVIIYKNTEWVKQLLWKNMFVFEQADKFKFAKIFALRHLVDQNVFNALVLGFDPPRNDSKYLLDGDGFLELRNVIKYELALHEMIPKWHSWQKCLDDEQQYVAIHDNYIGVHVRNHSAMIPQFYLNVLMGEWIYANYYQTDKFEYDPVIVHFASSIGKPYLSAPPFNQLKCSVHG